MGYERSGARTEDNLDSFVRSSTVGQAGRRTFLERLTLRYGGFDDSSIFCLGLRGADSSRVYVVHVISISLPFQAVHGLT